MARPSHPWWIALPFAAAVALMSAFAPGIIPDWVQAGLFALGLVLTIVSAVGALWYYRIAWGQRVVGSVLVIFLGITLLAAGSALLYIGFKQLQNRIVDAQESQQSTELSGLSNTQLRLRALDVAKSLRRFEREAPTLTSVFSRSPLNETKEQHQARFMEDNEKYDKLRKGYEAEFWDNMRPELLVLRKELRTRLKSANLYESDDQFYNRIGSIGAPDRILDYRSLAGSRPISDLADMIDGMARMLP